MCLLISLVVLLLHPVAVTSTENDIDHQKVSAKFIAANGILVSWFPPGLNSTLHVFVTTDSCSEVVEPARVLESTSDNGGEWLNTTFWDLKPLVNYIICYQKSSIHDNQVVRMKWESQILTSQASSPPIISNIYWHNAPSINAAEDNDEYVVIDGDVINLLCKGSGFPSVKFEWFRFHNDQLIKVMEGKNNQLTLNGSLVVEGKYHCEASNKYGRAISRTVTLKRAVLEAFSSRPPNNMEGYTGSNMEIPCPVPKSVPDPHITWKWIPKNETKDRRRRTTISQIEMSSRITVDQKGSLIFASLEKGDSGEYWCTAYNSEMGVAHHDEPTNVTVKDRFVSHLSTTLFFTEPHDGKMYGLVKEEAKFKCVFSGRPLPNITWGRVGGVLTDRHQVSDFNRTLKISNLQLHDAGHYYCTGSNPYHELGAPGVTKTFELIVQAKPSWKDSSSQATQNSTVGDTVTFECISDGIPKPFITWTHNGKILNNIKEILILQNVSKADVGTIGCQASNDYGKIMKNMALNVFEPISFIRRPESQILVPNSIIEFPCEVISNPSMILNVIWQRGSRKLEQSRTVTITDQHKLVLNLTNETDGGLSYIGTYTCVAHNRLEKKQVSVILSSSSTIYPKHSAVTYGNKDGFVWIYIVSCLGIAVVSILIMVAIVRRCHSKAKYGYSSTESARLLHHISAASRLQEERRALEAEGNSVDTLRYLENEQLKGALEEVFIPRKNIEKGELVGKGQFGRVYKGLMKDSSGKNGYNVALKTLKYKSDETDIVEHFLREALMMRGFKHPHILRLIGVSLDEDGSPMVVLPFMAYGDLRRFIQDPNREITVLELLRLGLQTARGMVYLASMHFVHRDLAARNCMIDTNMQVKVADFGLSRDLFNRDYYRVGDGKTPLPVRWMSPESLEERVYTTQSDVWSFGVLVWELMTRGAVPYPDIDNWDITGYVQSGKRLAQPLYCPDNIYNIMLRCWDLMPSKRPVFSSLVQELTAIVDAADRVSSSKAAYYLNIKGTGCSDYRDVKV